MALSRLTVEPGGAVRAPGDNDSRVGYVILHADTAAEVSAAAAKVLCGRHGRRRLMDAAARLTREYLHNLPAGCAPERVCAGSPLAGDIYGDAFLTRPVLLGQGESREVGERISRLYDLPLTLPERRYGGDLRAFTAALGWPPEQIAATLRADGRPRELPRSARADLYRVADGFRLLELNGGSPWAVGTSPCSTEPCSRSRTSLPSSRSTVSVSPTGSRCC